MANAASNRLSRASADYTRQRENLFADVRSEFGAESTGVEAGEREKRHLAIPNVTA